jgi:hypothetical protein
MPLNIHLNVNYTAAQKTTIENGLNSARTEMENVVGVPLNLSVKERGSTPSVDEHREMYVRDAIENLADIFPNMLGEEITPARAKALWEYRNSNMAFMVQLQTMIDFLEDTTINAENFCLKFTEDMRANAERYKGRNVHGADVVWDRLKGLHKYKIAATKTTEG